MRYLLCALCFWACTAQAEVMEVRAEPGADEKLVVVVKKAMESYNAILEDEMGLALQKSVRIDICPSVECYSNKVYDFGNRGEVLEKVARSTGGMANPTKRQIAVKLTNVSQLKMVNKLISHEMTHFLQNELSEGSSRQTTWIHEGMADFVGALVAQKMGSQSFEKWKLEVINTLRRADEYPMPQELAAITGRTYIDWISATDKYRGKNYSMADLMVAYLYEQKGQKLFGELVGYYRCLSGVFTSESACFSQSFGVVSEQFYLQVQAWATNTLAKVGGLEVAANGQDAIAAEVGKTYAVAQALLEEKLGRKLEITMRIHLSQNQVERAAQLVDELGISEEDAQKRAKGGDLIWQDSLMFIDTSRSNTPAKRADMIGQLAMGRYLQLRAGNMNQVYWFYLGLRDWMAVQLQEKLGMRTAMQSAEVRQEILAKAKKGMPALAELTTPAGWSKANVLYGNAVVRQIALEATQSVLAEKGVAELGRWVETYKRLNGSPDAFTQAFGEPVDKFVQAFKSEVVVN